MGKGRVFLENTGNIGKAIEDMMRLELWCVTVDFG